MSTAPRQIYVTVREGVNVRDDVSKMHLPRGGCWVPENSYYVRVIAAGDLVVTPPPVVELQIPDSQPAGEE